MIHATDLKRAGPVDGGIEGGGWQYIAMCDHA